MTPDRPRRNRVKTRKYADEMSSSSTLESEKEEESIQKDDDPEYNKQSDPDTGTMTPGRPRRNRIKTQKYTADTSSSATLEKVKREEPTQKDDDPEYNEQSDPDEEAMTPGRPRRNRIKTRKYAADTSSSATLEKVKGEEPTQKDDDPEYNEQSDPDEEGNTNSSRAASPSPTSLNINTIVDSVDDEIFQYKRRICCVCNQKVPMHLLTYVVYSVAKEIEVELGIAPQLSQHPEWRDGDVHEICICKEHRPLLPIKPTKGINLRYRCIACDEQRPMNELRRITRVEKAHAMQKFLDVGTVITDKLKTVKLAWLCREHVWEFEKLPSRPKLKKLDRQEEFECKLCYKMLHYKKLSFIPHVDIAKHIEKLLDCGPQLSCWENKLMEHNKKVRYGFRIWICRSHKIEYIRRNALLEKISMPELRCSTLNKTASDMKMQAPMSCFMCGQRRKVIELTDRDDCERLDSIFKMKTFTKELDQFGRVMICGGHVTKEYKMKTTNIINWCRICRAKSDCRVHPKLRIDMNVAKRLDLSLGMDGKLFNIAAKGEMANMCYKHADYKLFVYDGSEQDPLSCILCGLVATSGQMFRIMNESMAEMFSRYFHSKEIGIKFLELEDDQYLHMCFNHLPELIVKEDWAPKCLFCAEPLDHSKARIVDSYGEALAMEKMMKLPEGVLQYAIFSSVDHKMVHLCQKHDVETDLAKLPSIEVLTQQMKLDNFLGLTKEKSDNKIPKPEIPPNYLEAMKNMSTASTESDNYFKPLDPKRIKKEAVMKCEEDFCLPSTSGITEVCEAVMDVYAAEDRSQTDIPQVLNRKIICVICEEKVDFVDSTPIQEKNAALAFEKRMKLPGPVLQYALDKSKDKSIFLCGKHKYDVESCASYEPILNLSKAVIASRYSEFVSWDNVNYSNFVDFPTEKNVLKCLICGVVDAHNPMFLLASPSFLQVIQKKGNSERLYKPLQNNYCCLRHLPQCILKDDYGIFCTLCARRPNESSVHVVTRYSDASLVEKLLKLPFGCLQFALSEESKIYVCADHLSENADEKPSIFPPIVALTRQMVAKKFNARVAALAAGDEEANTSSLEELRSRVRTRWTKNGRKRAREFVEAEPALTDHLYHKPASSNPVPPAPEPIPQPLLPNKLENPLLMRKNVEATKATPCVICCAFLDPIYMRPLKTSLDAHAAESQLNIRRGSLQCALLQTVQTAIHICLKHEFEDNVEFERYRGLRTLYQTMRDHREVPSAFKRVKPNTPDGSLIDLAPKYLIAAPTGKDSELPSTSSGMFVKKEPEEEEERRRRED